MVRKLNPERKTQFLKAALKLFVEKGVQHTSTAEIAREAGTAAGTLFLYFPTKQDLLNELTLNIGREQSEYINGLLNPSLPARETFQTIWEGSIRWLMEHLDAYRYVQQVRNTRIIDEKTIQESAKYFHYYYSAIQKGLAEKAIKPYPIELVGETIYKQIETVMNLIGMQADPAKREEYIRMGFEIFWNGIRTGAAEEEPEKGKGQP